MSTLYLSERDGSQQAWDALPMRQLENLILRQDADVVEAKHRHPAAQGPGIYALFDRLERLAYIGKSVDVSTRIYQHRMAARYRGGMRFQHYACLAVPLHLMRDVECAHIYALEPPLNSLYEPVRWKRHADMVEAIRNVWVTETES